MESWPVKVLLPNAKDGGTFDALSYTVFADGTLEIHLADETRRTYSFDEWMDVRFLAR
jgi:hypothetical protein